MQKPRVVQLADLIDALRDPDTRAGHFVD